MFRALLCGFLALSPGLSWPCAGDGPLTPECAALETDRITTAYLKAALAPAFLESLEADPTPDARLVWAMLLAIPPAFNQDPNAAPAPAAVARADRALTALVADYPDHLVARIVALDRCEQRNDSCRLAHGAALRFYFPDNAVGYLIGAHHRWQLDQSGAALELLHRAGEAAVYDWGYGALVQTIYDVLDRLPPDIADAAPGRRDPALYDVGFGLTAALSVPHLRTIQEICRPTDESSVVDACLAAARAMRLPGANALHSAIALAIERTIYDALGDERNLERAITETAVLHQCAESVAIAESNRDPALMAAYLQDLDRLGECRALERYR